MPRAGLTAERLTEAAAELADAEGLEQVTLTALAKQYAVAVPSLYSHVRNTDDLRTRVTLLALEEMADRAERAVRGRRRRAGLSALAGSYRRYAHEHPGRYAATRLPLDDESAAASAGPRHAVLAREVLGGYALSPSTRTHAVRIFGATVHGFVTLELAGGFSHSRPSAESSWRHAVAGLDTLFTSWEKQ